MCACLGAHFTCCPTTVLLLVQKYKYWEERVSRCSIYLLSYYCPTTSTKVQIVTQEERVCTDMVGVPLKSIGLADRRMLTYADVC